MDGCIYLSVYVWIDVGLYLCVEVDGWVYVGTYDGRSSVSLVISICTFSSSFEELTHDQNEKNP